jgi:hypothetical protein
MSDTRESPSTASDAALERLEKKLRIDKHGLDDELVEQAAYLNEVAQYCADAVSYRDEAKANLEGTRAKLDQQLRQQGAEETKRVTDTAVAAMITGHPEFQRAQDRFGAWVDRTNRWNGLREAVSQRGFALKDLTSLYIAGYWATHTMAPETRAVRTATATNIKTAVAEQRSQKRQRLPDDE